MFGRVVAALGAAGGLAAGRPARARPAARALPVLGCTQKGALSRWLRFLETSTSRRGYACASTISLRARASAPRRARPSAALPSSTCGDADRLKPSG